MTELRVQLAYALPEQQWLVDVVLPAGAAVADAIARAGLTEWAADAIAAQRIGIFGHACTPETLLRDGDRIEFYRPLQVDPKEVRRQRAAHSR